MAAWLFPHQWASTYQVTLSFKTDVLTSQSGYEQRIAQRGEPRRTITTEVLRDDLAAQALDRFVWRVGPDVFQHTDPTSGYVSQVRFGDQQTISHVSTRVASATISLSVEPGTDNITYDEPNAYASFASRYVFPFAINRSGSRDDTLALPRRTADFGRGRISVTRPVAFATRSLSMLLLRVGRDETDALSAFFAAMRGRQGEFWGQSHLDDLTVLETVSNTVTVAGADVADTVDVVNVGLAFTTWQGDVFYRRVTGAAVSGNTTLLQLDNDVPVRRANIERCAWLRLCRFASDDLTIEWTTAMVAQSQVQFQTVPYEEPETAVLDEGTAWLLDYHGGTFAETVIVGPLLDVLNRIEPQFATEN